jgi:hypothetical protein
VAQQRKEKLENGEVYHIFTRSIAKFVVFNNDEECLRMKNILNCYRYTNFNYKYSHFAELDGSLQEEFLSKELEMMDSKDKPQFWQNSGEND